MREAFIERKFSDASLRVIATANQIIADYQAMGFTLTLRQLYYQFVAKHAEVLDPKAVAEGRTPNTIQNYKRLGSILNDARLAGRVDWAAIEDRTRNLETHSAWTSPRSIIEICAEQYAENPWLDQDSYVEVWIEKEALVGVIEPVCERWRVPYFACRGYVSQSEQYTAGKRFAQARRRGKTPIVLYLGDHDPSGMDMTRDNQDRLSMFSRMGVDVRRLALNWEQIEEYDPPPNPAKEGDSRSTGYIERFGESSWELDALPPDVIDSLIEAEIEKIVEPSIWAESLEAEARNKATLARAADRWDEVEALVAPDEDEEDPDVDD